MPTIRMPDNQIVRFPDEMSDEEIKGMISQKYPDVIKQPSPVAEIPQPAAEAQLPTEEEKSLMEQAGEAVTSRAGLRAIGGTVGAIGGELAAARTGAMIGARGGAILGPWGVVGGTVLGGIAGTLFGDLVADVLRPEERPENIREAYEKLKEAGVEEVGAQIVGAALPPVVRPFKAISKKITGALSEGAKEVYSRAADFGIELAPANLTDNKFVEGWRKVMGVMPFAGNPFTKAAKTQAEQVEMASGKILNELAPNVNMFEAGIDMVDAAQRSFKKFREQSSKLYGVFEERARNLENPNVFDATPLKEAAQDIIEYRSRQAIPGVERPGEPDVALDIAQGLLESPDRLAIEQLRGLNENINNIIADKKLRGLDVSDLVGLKKSVEQSMGTIDPNALPAEAYQELVGSLKAANQFYSENIKRFQTATAKKFGRVEKNLFKVGFAKPGMRPDDQSVKAVFDTNSPQAIRELREVVGAEAFNKTARNHLEATMKNVIKETDGIKFVDPSSFIKKFKLDTPEGEQVMREMLAGSKLDPDTISKFTKVMKDVAKLQPTDPSTFLMRRLTLGGIGAVAVASAAPFVTIPVLALSNRFSNAIANPAVMKSFIRSQNAKISTQQRVAATVRMLRLLDYEEEAKEYKDFIKQIRVEKPTKRKKK